jgi:hypothetical protein
MHSVLPLKPSVTQNLLTIITLGDIQHLVDGLEPIISIKGIY